MNGIYLKILSALIYHIIGVIYHPRKVTKLVFEDVF